MHGAVHRAAEPSGREAPQDGHPGEDKHRGMMVPGRTRTTRFFNDAVSRAELIPVEERDGLAASHQKPSVEHLDELRLHTAALLTLISWAQQRARTKANAQPAITS